MEPRDYSTRFTTPEEVAHYEGSEYGRQSYSTCIWELQKPVLWRILEGHRAKLGSLRLLDFACGTGRVLSFMEPLADSSEGLDISPEMAALAKAKCVRSQISVGDICAEPTLVSGKYGAITAFRFLLNAQPSLREDVLRQLRAVIAENGILVANVHGNSRSLRHPFVLFRKWQRKKAPERFAANFMVEEMSPKEVRQLFERTGFEVVEQIGFGLLPQFLYRTFLRGLAWRVDRALSGVPLLRNVCVDLLFVCRVSP